MMSKNCQLGHILLRLLDNPSRNCVKLSWVVQLLLEMNPISVAQEKWESWANIASWDIFLLRMPDNPSRNRAELAIIPSCSMWSVCGDSLCNDTKIQNCSHKYMNTHKIMISKQNEIFNGSFDHMFNAMFSMVVSNRSKLASENIAVWWRIYVHHIPSHV